MRHGKISTMIACKLVCTSFSYTLFLQVFLGFVVFAFLEILTPPCNLLLESQKDEKKILKTNQLLLLILNNRKLLIILFD